MKLRREKLPSQDTDTPHKPPSVSSPIADSKPDIAALAAISVSPHRPRKRKRIPYTLVEASKGNRCPTSGCDGVGHITGLYAMHFAVSGCPLAHGKTPEECKARREELNRLRTKTLPPQESGGEGGGGVEENQNSKHLKMTSNTGGSTLPSSRRTTAVSPCTLWGEGGGGRKREGGGVGGGRKGERGRRREMGMGKEKFEGGGRGGKGRRRRSITAAVLSLLSLHAKLTTLGQNAIYFLCPVCVSKLKVFL